MTRTRAPYTRRSQRPENQPPPSHTITSVAQAEELHRVGALERVDLEAVRSFAGMLADDPPAELEPVRGPGEWAPPEQPDPVDDDAPAGPKPRRRLERIVDPNGQERVQRDEPRADVLWYPTLRWTTVLVRRTHDPVKARALAEQCWEQCRDLADDKPLSDRHRVGWWYTGPPNSSTGTADAKRVALDQVGRPVVWWDPDAGEELPAGAGAGVEFRP